MLMSAALRRARTITRNPLAALSLVFSMAALLLFVPSAQAGASTSLVGLTNNARASSDLPPLAVSADLSAAASRQASRMAASGTLYHTPNLGGVVCCWSSLGENVGEGASTGVIFSAFMASPEHRANILNSSYTQIGVGIAVDSKGTMWVSEIFRRPSGVVSAQPPAPAPQARQAQPPRTTATVVRPPAPPPRVAAPGVPSAPPQRASRDLARPPVVIAQRFAAALSGQSAERGLDPVSRMLAFVAATGGAG